MKRLLFLLLLFSCVMATAQDATNIYQLAAIPEKGITLNEKWVFKAGDDLAWATPSYNHNDWMPVDPTDEIHHLPQVRNAGMGWFRLKMDVDSALRGKSFAMLISGFGAMEIYLNGNLTYSFGKPDSQYASEKTSFFTSKLMSLTFGQSAQQTIAIRYSFNKRNLYIKFANKRPIIKIELKQINQGIDDHIKFSSFESTLRTIQVSFYLPLGFLLLFLYMSFRPQKEYLYTGIFCLSLFLAIFFHILALSEPVTINHSNSFLLITQVLYIVGAISFIHSIFLLYKKKKNWFFYFVVIYGVFSIPFYFISYDLSGFVNAFFFPIINLEFLRLSILAVYRRRKGAVVLLLTSIVFALAIVSYIFFSINHNSNASALFQGISFLIPGFGLSIFYAGEFARTASAERQRTIEVEKLSKEMIEKEREKQLILGAQNETLEKQVTERTAALEKSLQDLKDTEQQLIQREKMASLGELTAGIAHEIQNPLNFVNNFSDLNSELIAEMKDELAKGNIENAIKVADCINENEQKILFHGKRADGIVKGMLQHSRSSTATKEPTDINKLADEYLRLGYHGLRAKDKSFNATMKTDFDETIGHMNIIPQDIGRVIINLITNAFYAVTAKKKQGSDGYEPTVTVSTKKIKDGVEIRVRDNGNGIPQKIVDKIFQPFFTTKPTGQGTGLGLSLSYDIVRAHGGELTVETKEGDGAEFIINLP